MFKIYIQMKECMVESLLSTSCTIDNKLSLMTQQSHYIKKETEFVFDGDDDVFLNIYIKKDSMVKVKIDRTAISEHPITHEAIYKKIIGEPFEIKMENNNLYLHHNNTVYEGVNPIVVNYKDYMTIDENFASAKINWFIA